MYSKSVNVGTVRLYDIAGHDRQALERAVEATLKDYGNLSLAGTDMYGVGGTATSLAALFHELPAYDPKVVDGTVLTVGWLGSMAERLLSMSVEERKAMRGMDVRRADVIAGGCLLLHHILKRFGAEKLTMSESDNLEGYVLLKGLAK